MENLGAPAVWEGRLPRRPPWPGPPPLLPPGRLKLAVRPPLAILIIVLNLFAFFNYSLPEVTLNLKIIKFDGRSLPGKRFGFCDTFFGSKFANDLQILKFDGGETSAVPYLERDSAGRHLSSLSVDDIQLEDRWSYSP